MATPHIACEPGDIAPLVIMPGDPKRAERIAKTRMKGARLVSDVRGIGAWTGTVDGVAMTAMASGMGVPSVSIYATELYSQFGVKRICRVGTCGGISKQVAVRDVIVASSAHTNSSVSTIDIPGVTLSLAASFDMLRGAVDQARGTGARQGRLASNGTNARPTWPAPNTAMCACAWPMGSNSSTVTPPQHWPRLAPRLKRSR